MMISVLAAVAVAAVTAGQQAPTGLLADFQKSPALGVRAAPRFTWIVPPCPGASDHVQTGYRLVVSADKSQIWDSGMVNSNDSTYVAYAGPALAPGTPYEWTVTTETAPASGSGAACTSAASAPASFITALFGPTGWDQAKAKLISVAGQTPTFAYFRKEVTVPAGVTSAQAFISAPIETPLLNNYKLFIDGELVSLGPGRGEAPVWATDPAAGAFSSWPYVTNDLSSYFASAGTVVIAIEAMHSRGAEALMQLQLRLPGGKVVTTGTDATWSAFNGDVHRNPGKGTHGGSAGTGYIEFIDARAEPVGWMAAGFKPGAGWAPAAAVATFDYTQLHAKMEPPMEFTEMKVIAIKEVVPQPPSPGPGPRPPPSPSGPPATCVKVGENSVADIGCAAGEVISSIDFADFGTPTGSCATGDGFIIDPKCSSNHSMAVITAACMGKAGCDIPATCTEFHERLQGNGAFCWDIAKSLAVKVSCKKQSAAAAITTTSETPPAAASPSPKADGTAKANGTTTTSFWADFGREFQGGVRLTVADGVAGQTVDIACGEATSLGENSVSSTWGWEFTWTLRDGPQVLEQHKFMECRFVMLTFNGSAPSNFTLDGWKVHYPYDHADSAFTSSNATLNAVFELCRYTLEADSLDTYTDSNTRERRPYEADGIIAASARLLIQRDYLWGRHSHAWVLQYPTWPVEWQQTSPYLGWQDYMATGQPDLALAFEETMYTRTKVGFLDPTGLLDTSKMGRHIVDWMPDGSESDQTVKRGEFTNSDHTSVSNAFAAHGLELLAEMVGKGGRAANATAYAKTGAALKAQIVKQMWNGTNFCDGPCKDVGGNSRMMTNMFMLAFGMVPAGNIDAAWSIVADWGIEGIGDYGAFWYQLALSSSYYANFEGDVGVYDGPDDGTAIVTALTKCDEDSWCSGLLEDNLTTTRESWHAGTYSHEWGTSAIVGATMGIMGVHQTAPGFATFTVKPKLGSLTHAAITVPSLRGYINVTAGPSLLEVDVPCSTAATLCVPRSTADSGVRFTPATHRLLLDGAEVASVPSGGHLCAAAPVGCGADGATRSLTAQLR